ncbi:MAG: GTP cyclohydrolase II RibA [Actinoallomurus sp.]
MTLVREVARVGLPTTSGDFQVIAYGLPSGFVYLALVKGAIGNGESVLTRVHSECLTGDVLGSLRCDCGLQLQAALRALAAEGRGVLVYATGQEGRGIGLVNKLRAYREQDAGADTLEANLRLGLPGDQRRYTEAAAVLRELGVRSVRLLTNNPRKAEALQADGIGVVRVEQITTAPHLDNRRYLRTKRDRMGHLDPAGSPLPAVPQRAVDATSLLGHVRVPDHRPYVLLKYAQTLDGRIATGTGDSQWISGEAERRVSHALRAACDAVLVGVRTVLRDDPQLTVRLVNGSAPLRVVLDSRLRIPLDARILDADAPTVVITTDESPAEKRHALAARDIGVRVVRSTPQGVDLRDALRLLRSDGVRTLMVEGGARVLTSLLAARLADRLVASISGRVLGSGTEAVGDLGIDRVADAVTLTGRSVHVVGDDVLLAYDVAAGADREAGAGQDAGTDLAAEGAAPDVLPETAG